MSGPGPTSRQISPTVASLRRTPSLRARLVILVALGVAVVISVQAYLQIRLFERTIEQDLLDTAARTAQAVADDVELSPEPWDRRTLEATLHEFVELSPALRVISVVMAGQDGMNVLASTSSSERISALDLARQALTSGEPRWAGVGTNLRTAAVPIMRRDHPVAVALATVSLLSAGTIRSRAGLIAIWLMPAAIIVLTLFVDLLARRFVHRPIGVIHETMRRAATGQPGIRAPVIRRDEIGTVAEGLNHMLGELEGFSSALEQRVRGATDELQARNAELVDSYQRQLQLREALADAERMATLGQTAANVAHQIGTPLNLISGYVQMIMEEEGESSRVTERLRIVEAQIGRVTDVVRSMLDRSRRPALRESTDPAELVRRIAEVTRPKLESAAIRLDLSIADTLPSIDADPVRLELVLLNLISNSLDAMPGGGVLSVRVWSSEGQVHVQVSDTGAGIAPDVLPRVFEPWVTTKPPGQGTGLGLSIARDVIAGHGGSITVDSTVGVGTTFSIALPVKTTSLSATDSHAQDTDR